MSVELISLLEAKWLSFYKMSDQRILSGGTYWQISPAFYVLTFRYKETCCLGIKQRLTFLTQICIVKQTKAKQMEESNYPIFQRMHAFEGEGSS